MRSFLKHVDAISEVSGKAIAWLALVLTIVVAYDVIARYVFKSATIWAFDLAYMLYATHFMVGLAYVHAHKSHIRVDVLLMRFSPRTRAGLEVFYYVVFFFPLMAVLTWSCASYAAMSWSFKEVSIWSPWRPPVYPIKTVAPIAFFLLGLQGIADFIRNLKFLVGRTKT